MRAHWYLPLPLLLALGGCDIEDMGSLSREQEDFHYTYALRQGGRFSIETFNGTVEIAAWDQDKVEIHGTKYATSRDRLAEIRIDVQHNNDAVSVRVVPPIERRGNTGARFTIRVPRRVELDRIISSNGSLRIDGVEGTARLRTSNGAVRIAQHRGLVELATTNGSIEVRDVKGPVSARSSNGRITVEELTGDLDASTTNGSIRATVQEGEGTRPMKVSTTNGSIELTVEGTLRSEVRGSTSNGSITVRMPAATNARVSAVTSNSSVTTDFDVKVSSGEISKKRLEGRIGAGGPLVDLSTSNGSIRLLRSGS